MKVSHRVCCRFARSSKESGEARSVGSAPNSARGGIATGVQGCEPAPVALTSGDLYLCVCRRGVDLGTPTRALDGDRGGGAGDE